ncbi:hypothetical protein EZY14_020165 [Kordia sp. TARA_039_SRF]|nr:hypothetical protein EZY14_020165 [Kordia sp. TARA_039_SRF]MAF32296.1 hypothetical protein [Magnetococcales bacterium]|tara:strand:+ start:12014 stop:12634 length:621 start_codon:yes stop_codon:yes gene_type:complete
MKHYIKLIAFLGILSVLGGCASNNKLDYDTNEALTTFKSYEDMKKSFKALEEKVDQQTAVDRDTVHKSGFDPAKTAVEFMDWTAIGDKFTAGGNEVLADEIRLSGGEVIPPAVKACLKKGKNCTAYRVRVVSNRSIERPEGSFGTLKSALKLKEIRHVHTWSFSCIIVFENNRAVYAQVEEDVAPNVTITTEKNSAWKKIGHAVVP